MPIIRAEAAISCGTIVRWSRRRRATCWCTRAVSPTTTRGSPPRPAHDTSWSHSLTRNFQYATFIIFQVMTTVLILYGGSEHVAHVWTVKWICLSTLLSSQDVLESIEIRCLLQTCALCSELPSTIRTILMTVWNNISTKFHRGMVVTNSDIQDWMQTSLLFFIYALLFIVILI